MQTKTLLLIILSALVALGIAWFQYYYKIKKRGKLNVFLSFLRFITIFSTFLLLINPKFIKDEFTIEKTNLILLTDNSSSIKESTTIDSVTTILAKLRDNEELSKKFNISSYVFGEKLNNVDSLSLNEPYTNISKALQTLNEVYANSNSLVVLLSDGNQNIGEDYEFSARNLNSPIYPVVLGDTTQYEDLKISQINANKYAFLKNKYPIEARINYDGKRTISALVEIKVNGSVSHRETVSFSSKNASVTINFLLTAKSVGNKRIEISVSPLQNERNTRNNSKVAIVEVVDEQTNVAIISDISHPDIAALKKAMESNEQRSVSIYKSNESVENYNEVDLFVLYQPDASFQKTYDYISLKNTSIFTITGPHTDWQFLNRVQHSFTLDNSNLVEELVPISNSNFGIFNTSGFDSNDFPPLKGELGVLIFSKPYEPILNQRIKGIDTGDPLLVLIPGDTQREAVLLGENLWKWRMQSFRNQTNFENFDTLVGKIVFYLTANESKERLLIDYESVNTTANGTTISATYFNEAFEFEPNANLIIDIKGENVTKEVPFLSRNNSYEVDLSDLPSGDYDFTVSVQNDNLQKSGHFSILEFNLEQQLVSSDYTKLGSIAASTNGQLYYPSEVSQLIQDLTENPEFIPIQKSTQNSVSLISFKFLLGLIAAALALEWFIRKYNGLT